MTNLITDGDVAKLLEWAEFHHEQNWIEEELSRRYLLGAISHISSTTATRSVFRTGGEVEAIKILVDKLNRQTPGFIELVEEEDRSFPESHNMIDDLLEHR